MAMAKCFSALNELNFQESLSTVILGMTNMWDVPNYTASSELVGKFGCFGLVQLGLVWFGLVCLGWFGSNTAPTACIAACD